MKKFLLSFSLLLIAGVCHAVTVPMDIVQGRDAVIYDSNTVLVTLGPELAEGDFNTFEWVSDSSIQSISITSVIDEQYGSYLVWLGRSVGALPSFIPTDLGSDLLQWLAPPLVAPTEVTDSSTNAVDALLVGSICATFDGVADAIRCGDVNATQNPKLRCFVFFTNVSNNDWTISRRTSSTSEYQLYNQTDLKMRFSITGSAPVISSETLSLNTWYEVEAWYDRAGAQLAVRVRLANSPAWITTTLGSIPDTLLTGASDFTIGGDDATGLLTEGSICGVEISDFLTGLPIENYPLVEGSGATAHGTLGNNNGAITTGAGGTSTFWGQTQDVFHDMAIRGGTVVIEFAEDGVAFVPAQTTDTGLALSMRVKIPSFSDCTLLNSASKLLTAEQNGALTELYYDSVFIGNVTNDEWITISTTVDSSTTTDIFFGSTVAGRDDAFEFAWATLADNGSWSGASFNETDTLYNMDFPSDFFTSSSNLTKKQYPALADLTGDVDGAGLQNPGGVAVHNGGIYGIKEVEDAQVVTFNGTDAEVNGLSGAPVGSFSIESWFNSDFTTATAMIYASGTGSIQSALALSSATVRLYIGGNSDQVRGTTALSAGWHHLVGTWDGVTGKIYINGVEDSTTINGTPNDPVTGSAWIGRNTFSNFFEGDVARVRVYTEAISQARITALFDGGLHAVDTLNMTDDFLAENASGSTWTNSGTGSDGTLANTTFTANQVVALSPFGLNGFWYSGDNGVLFDSKTYIDLLTHTSYVDNVWVKYVSPTPVCLVEDIATTADLDADQWDGMFGWHGNGSCGAGVWEPLEATDGYLKDSGGEYIFATD